ncbi:hypothetical protein Dimus_014806 [Dionaea muscipula]
MVRTYPSRVRRRKDTTEERITRSGIRRAPSDRANEREAWRAPWSPVPEASYSTDRGRQREASCSAAQGRQLRPGGLSPTARTSALEESTAFYRPAEDAGPENIQYGREPEQGFFGQLQCNNNTPLQIRTFMNPVLEAEQMNVPTAAGNSVVQHASNGFGVGWMLG